MPQDFRLPLTWPAPADAAAAERLVERFAALDPDGIVPDALLRSLGGNAPYLADLAARETEALRRLAREGPDRVVADALAAIAALPATAPRARVAASLRAAKRVVALAVAVADIGGLWPLERITAALSDLAELALQAAVNHLLRAAHDADEITLPDPDRPAAGSGFVVLGMGKLGGRELNYSSDIDLILLHDPEAELCPVEYCGAVFTRIARGLVGLMEARDADGYVFRVDLRLRPDPAATPPCLALPGAITYYESMGLNWERAAMLKARPVAGDLAAGAAFLDAIRPFVWRRHLDFAAMADIHAMKQRIGAHRGTGLAPNPDPVARIAGHNLKLGMGGIREIEFLAQTLQLVWGGREPALRVRATLAALPALVAAGHLSGCTAEQLAAAYRFLRRLEHRLQMVADRQTHSLPEKPEALDAFALFAGYQDAAGLAAELLHHLDRVRAAYRELFEAVPDAPEGAGLALDFQGPGDASPQTIAALKDMGYNNPLSVIAVVQSWLSGRVRALRSERSRELMTQLLPTLLASVGRQREPDVAFTRLDALLGRLPAGVQLLSMFQRNPALLERVVAVLGAARSLADHLARTPSALEGLLTPGERAPVGEVLTARLQDARALEDAIATIRGVVREENFAISVATLEARLDADAAGALRAELADAAIAALLPRVLEDFATRFGEVEGGGLAVVLLGKAGGREMMAGSDLDLMLVYDHPEEVTQSTGPRVLPASQWFIRAVHAFIAALTAPDAAGPLYAVDMRLRPSGNKGPVAVSLAAFERYHAPGGGAWTWERMALTRARVVAGPPALRTRVEGAIRAALAGGGPATRIRADAAAMRARLARELPAKGPWDVKHRPGGGVEVEFIAQALQLAHIGAHPEIAQPATRDALARLGAAGVLPAEEVARLVRADRIWRTVQGMLRLTEGRGPPEHLSAASADTLLRALRALDPAFATVDAAGLSATLESVAAEVRASFLRHIGPLAGEGEA
jgi:glutamate-ammonia-ligase adenylyltransferase